MSEKVRRGIFDFLRETATHVAGELDVDLKGVVEKGLGDLVKDKKVNVDKLKELLDTKKEAPKKARRGIFDVFRDKVENVIDELENDSDAADDYYQKELGDAYDGVEDIIDEAGDAFEGYDEEDSTEEYVEEKVRPNVRIRRTTVTNKPVPPGTKTVYVQNDDDNKKAKAKGKGRRKGRGKGRGRGNGKGRGMTPEQRAEWLKVRNQKRQERKTLRQRYESLTQEERTILREEFLRKYLELGGDVNNIKKGISWRERFDVADDDNKIEMLKNKFEQQKKRLRRKHKKIRQALARKQEVQVKNLEKKFQQSLVDLSEAMNQKGRRV